MLKQSLVLATLVLGCSAEVVKEDPTSGLDDGEGGYLGTGQTDIDAAVKEACDILNERLPKCPQETCTEQAYQLFRDGERTGCTTEAVDLMYCAVENANEFVCLGHHECDSLHQAYDECFRRACEFEPEKCGPA